MLFHTEKKAEKWIDAAESIYLCYYESDDDECGPSLMKSVKLHRREGLHTFWFSADAEGDIEELWRIPEIDAFFLYGSYSSVHLIGSLDKPECYEDTKSCQVRFTAKECWLNTTFHRKKIPFRG